ncbi:hypothetical protein GCM10022252_41000 [Streptosporangium oxazolinicum]|uniref:Uncharacterized protein n=1 Tax=Streptosporangium oxazolinicum TaxID=909287 RepID=A0ABP8B213_9ACTN
MPCRDRDASVNGVKTGGSGIDRGRPHGETPSSFLGPPARDGIGSGGPRAPAPDTSGRAGVVQRSPGASVNVAPISVIRSTA